MAGRPLAGSGTGYGGALTFPDLAKTPHGSALAASMRRDRALAAAALVAEAEGDEEEAAAQAAVAAAAAGPDGEEGVTPPPQLFDELGEPKPAVLGRLMGDVTLRQLHEYRVEFKVMTDARGNAVAADPDVLKKFQAEKDSKKGGKKKKAAGGKKKKKAGGKAGGKKKGGKKKKKK